MLNKYWQWVEIVKPPQKKVLPDILTIREIERMINVTRELRYQTFILVVYSMGLRLGEALNLKVGDIDKERMKVHIRMGKGKKDRFVTLPQASLMAIRKYLSTHRPPPLSFLPVKIQIGATRKNNTWIVAVYKNQFESFTKTAVLINTSMFIVCAIATVRIWLSLA